MNVRNESTSPCTAIATHAAAAAATIGNRASDAVEHALAFPIASAAISSHPSAIDADDAHADEHFEVGVVGVNARVPRRQPEVPAVGVAEVVGADAEQRVLARDREAPSATAPTAASASRPTACGRATAAARRPACPRLIRRCGPGKTPSRLSHVRCSCTTSQTSMIRARDIPARARAPSAVTSSPGSTGCANGVRRPSKITTSSVSAFSK